MKRIAMAADHAGFSLKEKLKEYLEKTGYLVKDFGTYSQERCDYPEITYQAALSVSKGKIKQAVLICKSGIGTSIVANRLSGVRAALCHNVKCAQLSRQHNDSNILVLGSGFVNAALAKKILKAWLSTKFEGGRHRRRLNQIKAIEKKIRRDK